VHACFLKTIYEQLIKINIHIRSTKYHTYAPEYSLDILLGRRTVVVDLQNGKMVKEEQNYPIDPTRNLTDFVREKRTERVL